MPEAKKEETQVNWKKEFEDKQAECVQLHKTIADLKNDDRINRLAQKIGELVTLCKDLGL